MSCSVTFPRSRQRYTEESTQCLPDVLHRLLEPPLGNGISEDAWEHFVAAYSDLLLAVAARLGVEYDGVLDRYAYLLDELRRDDCRRLRRFVADGRSTFSTWLAVVARRLCLDHYRRRYGRLRRSADKQGSDPARSAVVACRRRLSDLTSALEDPDSLEDVTAPDTDDALDAERRRETLELAVARLAPSDRALLQLRFDQELTAREIAQAVGLPTPFHVYRRLNAVCETLRAAMAPPRLAGRRDARTAIPRDRSVRGREPRYLRQDGAPPRSTSAGMNGLLGGKPCSARC
jgi:RNA polymerase sigma factor (sigma-70 family)